jgi:MoxR-like ATPase
VLVALEEASDNPDRKYLVFLDELNRCQESARNALMPALDATRRVYHPIENTFIPIPDNVQFIAAVNRGREFTGTFGIDAAQLDRFAPLQMDYPPPKAEVEILAKRHPELSAANLEIIVEVADAIRSAADLPGSLSVRATDEACVYLAHPLFAEDGKRALPEIMKTSFCGRFPGRWDDVTTDAGAVWSIVRKTLATLKVPLPEEGAKD